MTCDSGFDGESYSCSVRIQRPNGDVFDRQSVIKQFGDWTIVWGLGLRRGLSGLTQWFEYCRSEWFCVSKKVDSANIRLEEGHAT